MEVLFTIEPLDDFRRVLVEVIDSLFEYGPPCTPVPNIQNNTINKAKDEIKVLIGNCDFRISQVSEALQQKNVDQDKLKAFSSLLEERKSALFCSMLAHSNSFFGDTFINFDWVLKIILGTSELKSLKYPLLQLVLITKRSNDKTSETVYDINKDMLIRVISALENIENV